MIKRFAFTMLLFAVASVSLHAEADTADAVYEDIVHEYVLNADGSTTLTYSHKMRLLTPYAFTRAYGESFITYNPEWQTLKVLRSVTTMADGRKVEIPFNAQNEVLPRHAAGAAPFSGLKEMVVTHTGLEVGALVDFAYQLHTKPGMFPGLMAEVLCGDRNPILNITIRVKVPSGTELQHGWSRDAETPVVSEEGGMSVFTWTRKNIPQFEVEEHQPAMDRVLPVLYFSTARFDEMPMHIFGPQGVTPLAPEAISMAEGIARLHEKLLDKAFALRDWVATRVGRSTVALDMLGYHCRSVEDMVKYNVASDLERAVLLSQLCRAVGLEAAPALFSRNITVPGLQEAGNPAAHDGMMMEITPEASPNVPALQLFPHAAVVCQGIEELPFLVLDPSVEKQSGPVPEQFRQGCFLPLDGMPPQVWYSGHGPRHIVAELTSDWSLDKEGMLSGRSSVRVDDNAAFMFDPEGFAKKVQSALASAGQGLKTTAGDVTAEAGGASRCEVSITSKASLEAHGDFYSFALPAPPGGITALRLPIGDRNRTTPVALSARMQEEQRMVIHLDGAFTAVDIPEPIELRNGIGSIRSTITADAHDVEITRVLTIDVDEIPPASYRELQELLRAWRRADHNTILFTRK
jgi:hypothetical protein